MKTILSVAMMMFAFIANSQTTVSGKVVDQNNEPIPGANVVIVGKAIGTTSDFDGLFKLETSEVPPFQIRISTLGYSNADQDVTENNQTFTIVLNESQTFLDEVVISASRTPERIFESPVSVERFGLKEIKNTTAESFYGGLQNLKGVDINTSSLTFQSINTRGFATFANTRFMQLVDGMDNSAPGLNFVLGNLVGMSELDVQSVEILPGASSALYGAGAFNGMLFMRSKNPFDFQGISSYVKTGITSQEAAGNNNYYDVGIRGAHAFSDKFAVKVNFSYLNGEDWHAVNEADFDNPGFDRTNPAYNGINVYGDEVGTTLNFDQLSGLPVAPGTLGSARVTRTGYNERDLVNYDAESLKADWSLNYRPFGDDLEVIYNGRIGRGTTIYQGANRYYVDGFKMQQHKLEIKNDNFFLRGYVVAENSGNAYDSRFAAINVNRQWKSDLAWFGDYAATFIGAKLGVGSGVLADDASAHAAARAVADTGRLIPGTPAFQSAFNKVINDGDLTTGAKFIDRTKFRHVNGNYNLAHLIDDWADVQVGGSFREYELNSAGTIFTDFDGPIKYSEYGAYTQVQKKFLDERLKFTGSIRYDKNEFFDGFFSPRVTFGYTAGANRNHNFRVSAQQGFRNPTTQDLFIGLDVGAAILVGSAPNNLDRDVRTYTLDPNNSGALLSGSPTATISGRDVYENSFVASSVIQFAQTGNPADLKVASPDIIKPEEITAIEAGYRSKIGKFTIDLSAYYNSYTNFIAQVNTIVPFYGDVELTQTIPSAFDPNQTPLAIAALANNDSKVYQAYTNSTEEVGSFGGTVGVDTKIFGNFDLGANYTYSKLDVNQSAIDASGLRLNFNTPEHKVKVSFGNTELFKNFGFGLNWRWNDSFFWEASFADGDVPSYSVLDAQVNYTIPKIKSVFKAGGSNMLGDEYFTGVGSAFVGSIYYLSWTINP